MQMASALRRCVSRLQIDAFFLPQKRFKYKQKWAVTGKKRPPSELALAYFDTYYEPLFGAKLWASMREAMLRDTKKYCALVNNFASSESTIVDLISEAGASDLWSVVGKPLLAPSAAWATSGYRDRQQGSGLKWRLPGLDGHDGSSSSEASGHRSAPAEQVPISRGTRSEELAAGRRPIEDDEQTVVAARREGGGYRDAEEDEEEEEEGEFITTPEGFLVPRPKARPSSAAVDLMEFVPVVSRSTSTDAELLLEAQDRQSMAPPSPAVERGLARLPVLRCEGVRMPHLLKAYVHDVGVEARFRQPKQDESGLLDYYLMDAASLLPVIALDLSPNDAVLDLCAGPGGKSLAIVQSLLFAKLVCVDSSLARLRRVTDSLTWYAPPSLLDSGKVSVLHQDGRRMGSQHAATYDKVLVDVPCTTDRQALHEDDNSLFLPSRRKERLKLPELQTQLLCSALDACRPGGTVVYSTCSLSPGQNDGVVEEACARAERAPEQQKIGGAPLPPPSRYAVVDTSDVARRLSHVFKFWNGCTYGQVVLPSVQANFGPLYFCKIKKLPE